MLLAQLLLFMPPAHVDYLHEYRMRIPKKSKDGPSLFLGSVAGALLLTCLGVLPEGGEVGGARLKCHVNVPEAVVV